MQMRRDAWQRCSCPATRASSAAIGNPHPNVENRLQRMAHQAPQNTLTKKTLKSLKRARLTRLRRRYTHRQHSGMRPPASDTTNIIISCRTGQVLALISSGNDQIKKKPWAWTALINSNHCTTSFMTFAVVGVHTTVEAAAMQAGQLVRLVWLTNFSHLGLLGELDVADISL